MLAVLLIAGIVAVMNSIPLSVKNVYGYSRFITGATPRGDISYFPKLQAHFKTSPIPIERTIIARTMIFNVNSIVGPWPFVMYGLHATDIAYLTNKIGFKKLNGRLPLPGKPEAVISQSVARNLSLGIGDVLLKPDDDKNYSPFEVKIVGVLEGDEWFAFTSYDYLAQNHYPPIDVLILSCKTLKEQRTLDEWTEKSLQGEKAMTFTYPQLEKDTEATFTTLFKILNFVIGLLVIVITIMMGMLINIYLSQRVAEFGLLQAIGFTRRSLVKRAIVEAVLVVVVGWVLGILATMGLLGIVRTALMSPRGFYIDPLDSMAYSYTIPVPIAIVLVAALTVFIRFKRFDPITVIERRIL